MGRVITIDGPAASGKSSVSRNLANQIGCSWVSTGAFYRAVAYLVKKRGASVNNEEVLRKLCSSGDWEVRLSPQKTLVFCDGKDISEEVYGEDVGGVASTISHFPMVREALLRAQRACSEEHDPLIAEGRDCGTVVFPEAEVKIYLTAESENRAKRRANEEGRTIEETQLAQNIRDTQDSRRKSAPLQIPPQAYVLDTSEMNLGEVVQKVKNLVLENLDC